MMRITISLVRILILTVSTKVSLARRSRSRCCIIELKMNL